MRIDCITENDLALWRQLVEDNQKVSFFFHPAWSEYARAAYGAIPVRLLLTQAGEPLALAQFTLSQHARDVFGWSRALLSTGMGHGGRVRYLSKQGRTGFPRLVQAVEAIAKQKKCSLIQLYVSSSQEVTQLRSLGFTPIRAEKIVINLTLSEKQLLKNMSRNSRRSIRKAEKQGVYIEERNDKQGIRTFYRLHLATQRRFGVPAHTFQEFETVWNYLITKGFGRLFLARIGKRVLGGVIMLVYHQTAYGLFSATSDYRRQVAPGHFTHWQVMQKLREEKVVTYDLGERLQYIADWSIFAFKKGLGARFIPCYAGEKVLQKSKQFLWYQMMKVTNRLKLAS